MENTQNVTVGGLGLTSVLLIVFITLKIVGAINWSWWIVILLPFAIDIAICLLAILLIVLIVVIGMAIGVKPKN